MKLDWFDVVAKKSWIEVWHEVSDTFQHPKRHSLIFHVKECGNKHRRINKQSIFDANNFSISSSDLNFYGILNRVTQSKCIDAVLRSITSLPIRLSVPDHGAFKFPSLVIVSDDCALWENKSYFSNCHNRSFESVICLKLCAIEAVFRDKYRTVWSMLHSSLLQQQLGHVGLFIIFVFNQRRESREKWEGKQNVTSIISLFNQTSHWFTCCFSVPSMTKKKAVYLSNQDI